jgi:hypothetical protein
MAYAHLGAVLRAQLPAGSAAADPEDELWLTGRLRQLRRWITRLERGPATAVERESGLSAGQLGVLGATEQKTTILDSCCGGRFAENDRWGGACIPLHSRRIPEPFEPGLTEKWSVR